jgi:flagellar hook-length control protein FliK
LLPQNESDVLPILSSGAEVFKSDFSLDLSKRAAEFAVDDKLLPQEESWKAAKTLDFGMLSSESQRLLDHSPNVMPPVAASVGQVVATDVKTAPVVTSVQVPVGSVGWGESLGQKVLWMAGQQTHVAELRLDPPHLGPMEVRLTVSNDQVTAIFISHQPAVRDALEAAMPRLREMFAESGMLLGDAMVSSDSLPQQQSSGREGRSASSAHVVDDGPQSWSAGGMISLSRDGRGMVDLFA